VIDLLKATQTANGNKGVMFLLDSSVHVTSPAHLYQV
jgi:hypothetical protein